MDCPAMIMMLPFLNMVSPTTALMDEGVTVPHVVVVLPSAIVYPTGTSNELS